MISLYLFSLLGQHLEVKLIIYLFTCTYVRMMMEINFLNRNSIQNDWANFVKRTFNKNWRNLLTLPCSYAKVWWDKNFVFTRDDNRGPVQSVFFHFENFDYFLNYDEHTRRKQSNCSLAVKIEINYDKTTKCSVAFFIF